MSVLVVLEEHRKAMGRRVVQLREAKGWSQETLAYHAKASAKTISRMENGERETRRHIIRQVADALEVNEVDLIGEPPAPLGLGAREDQVDNGFQEFREHVRDIRRDIADIAHREDTAAEEREAIRALLAQQSQILSDISGLLARQDMILTEIQRVVTGMPTNETLDRVTAAARQATEIVRAREAERRATRRAEGEAGGGAT